MQLELEAQEQQEVTDEVEQGTEEEINRLKETLAATSHEMEHIKEDYADRADKQSSYWRRQRLTSGTKTAESKPLKLKMSKLISKISNSIWKYDLTLRIKINSIYSERHPVLKCAASLTGSLLIQRLIINATKPQQFLTSTLKVKGWL